MTFGCLLRGFLAGTLILSLTEVWSFAGQQHNSSPTPSLSKMIEGVRGSVVGIAVRVYFDQPIPSSINCFKENKCVLGTGFFINDKADVVTASHVADSVTSLLQKLTDLHIAASAFLEVATPNFENEKVGGVTLTTARSYKNFGFRIQAEDRAHDIALLSPTIPNLFEKARQPLVDVLTSGKQSKPPASSPSAVTFDIARPQEGDDVFACGYPLNADEMTTTSGHIASTWESEIPTYARQSGLSQSVDVYRLDLTATFGNSGGPAFLDKNQSVLGMIIEVNGSPNGGGWTTTALPSHYITEMLDQHNITWKKSSSKQK